MKKKIAKFSFKKSNNAKKNHEKSTILFEFDENLKQRVIK